MNDDSQEPHKNGHDSEQAKIVQFSEAAERRRQQAEDEAQKIAAEKAALKEPLFNLPHTTKWLLFSFLIIQLAVEFALSPPQQYWVFSHFGFVPGAYTGTSEFTLFAIGAPLTYMFLHGGWLHLIMNSVMLTAFGAGVERWLGGRGLMLVFIVCGLIAALTQLAVSPSSNVPVVGASGGLSGLFAVVLVVMTKMRERAGMGRQNMLPFIILWIGITILFGVMGGPDGSSIAWAAHIGGFIGGFIVMRFLKIA